MTPRQTGPTDAAAPPRDASPAPGEQAAAGGTSRAVERADADAGPAASAERRAYGRRIDCCPPARAAHDLGWGGRHR